MSDERSLPARLGIVLINIPMPGLGLQRLGDRRALYFLVVAPVLLALTLVYYVLAPRLTFGGYAISALLILAAYGIAIIVSMVLSWRGSNVVRGDAPAWSRWYALVASYVAFSLVGYGFVEFAHGYYKPFYLPSEAMAPTLVPNDRLIASMSGPGELQRGDVILFQVGDAIYIKRLAALPGDRIELVDGRVIVNGQAVRVTPLGEERVLLSPYPGPYGDRARRFREQFQGESRPHEIYDFGRSPFDDFPQTVVPADHVFVLGDNRDNSADSRVPRDQMGVEMLPIAHIRGHALFYTWGPSGKMGTPINSDRP
jgi:signal peptidase I